MERRRGFETDFDTLNKSMQEIGDLLRQRRKELNLSLKEAENATSIRMAYLQSLEDGQLEKLISPIYAQGFFRQYASFLGMDGEKIVRDHPEIFNRPEPQDFAYGIGTLEMRGNPGGGVKWFPNLMWIAAFVGILFFAWYIAKISGVL